MGAEGGTGTALGRSPALLPRRSQRLPDPLESRRGQRAQGAGLMKDQTTPVASGRHRVWVTTAEAYAALGMSRETLRQLRLRVVHTQGKHYRRWGCTHLTGATAMAPGEWGGHHHWLEPAQLALANDTKTIQGKHHCLWREHLSA